MWSCSGGRAQFRWVFWFPWPRHWHPWTHHRHGPISGSQVRKWCDYSIRCDAADLWSAAVFHWQRRKLWLFCFCDLTVVSLWFCTDSSQIMFAIPTKSLLLWFYWPGTFMWIAGHGQLAAWSLIPCILLPSPRRSTCMWSTWRVWGRRDGACAATEPSRLITSASLFSSTSAGTLLPGGWPDKNIHMQRSLSTNREVML